ncbi:protein phosphatase 2C domain-containing protein [Nocardioides lentus]|uniref:Protein phosphatase 2C domain-containing protein n=1 Tax=Nocardioides lentus TaxID=338077 RepID=A0ABP5ARF2_9ACTN
MSGVRLHFGAATDVGLVREVNEDSYLAAAPVFVVADGMGGHAGGDVASRIVVEEFERLADAGYDPRRGAAAVSDTLQAAQERIRDYGARADVPGPWYAGTTAVVALVVEDDEGPKWLLANLGDSRVYKLLEGRLDQVSVDHSVVQELIDAGRLTDEQAARHPERHVVTRALGGPEPLQPDFFLLPLGAARRLVLCSDGVSGLIDDATLEAILLAAEDPRDAADRVVAAAVEAGGTDNATAVVVDVVGWDDDEGSYDAERQRESLHEKLGALP